jgi:enoyl-CoA hydratase/carnithine racemase
MSHGPNDRVSLSVDDGVAAVRLDDPDNYNAFSIPLAEDLLTHLLEVEDREDVSVVTLTAAGDTFCAGLDIDVLTGDDPEATERLVGYLDAVGSWLYTSDVPVVAGASGAAPGAGAILISKADIRVLGEDAELWWPEIQFGLKAYGEAADLVDAVGAPKATEIMLMGEDAAVSAAEARRLGFANRVVAPDEVADTVAGMAETIAGYDRQHGLVGEYLEVIHGARRDQRGTSTVYAEQLEREIDHP